MLCRGLENEISVVAITLLRLDPAIRRWCRIQVSIIAEAYRASTARTDQDTAQSCVDPAGCRVGAPSAAVDAEWGDKDARAWHVDAALRSVDQEPGRMDAARKNIHA
jgi:hypothetical protein